MALCAALLPFTPRSRSRTPAHSRQATGPAGSVSGRLAIHVAAASAAPSSAPAAPRSRAASVLTAFSMSRADSTDARARSMASMIAGSERAAWPPTTTGSQSLPFCAVHPTSWRIKDVLPAPGAPLKQRVWPLPRPLDTMSMAAAAAAVRSPSRPEKNGSGTSPARSTSATQSSYGTSSCGRSRPSSGTDMGAVIST